MRRLGLEVKGGKREVVWLPLFDQEWGGCGE